MNHPNSFTFYDTFYGKPVKLIAFPYFFNSSFGSLGLELIYEDTRLLERVVFSNVVFSGNSSHKLDTYIPKDKCFKLSGTCKRFNGLDISVMKQCVDNLFEMSKSVI